jgi:hypothetical protein
MRTMGVVAAALAFAAVTVAPGGAARTALPTIYVNYTMQCTFTITDDSGKAVTVITPGTWQVAVSTPGSFGGVDLTGTNDMTACKGSIDFHLTGPGVNLETTLNDGDGSNEMLSATFAPSSTYVAVDGNQPSVARAQFTTTASGPTTGASAAGTVAVATLSGTVGSAGKLELTYKGKSVATLKPGEYTVTVLDTSTHSGFVLRMRGKSAVTVSSAMYVGKKSVVVDLRTGWWYFAPTSRFVPSQTTIIRVLS